MAWAFGGEFSNSAACQPHATFTAMLAVIFGYSALWVAPFLIKSGNTLFLGGIGEFQGKFGSVCICSNNN
jgi:hypothetical protein